ncbi:hypothetical protein [Bradyrhizobium sp. 76]|uniref:hypothetical protein n=1 Tax=Bradyrhizobium sp. 76 TaxID=2782680 RepID=UPI001FF77563|nr:hypothetical protein [Bradyrhizobium sp. 76]MCK1407637.1 hypothetical protein [Bradyrhizobium sp. 76]
MTTDVATVLQRLIMAGENVLAMRDPGDTTALLDDVMDWLARPTDRIRVVHDYTLLALHAVQGAASAKRRSGDDHAVYYRVVGALLPDIRKDCWEAFQQRNRPTP